MISYKIYIVHKTIFKSTVISSHKANYSLSKYLANAYYGQA